ncbi:hypothetical protein AGMMS49944_29990 [Spirochaetia bacterium]|nr:hypothetical protein AGMMS49944_29990 [Spirochaetia bacterium]
MKRKGARPASGNAPPFAIPPDVGYSGGMAKKPVEKKERKPKRKTDLVENSGKVLVNLGQVVFGTLFLGGVLRGEVPQYIMVLSGIVGATVFIVLGLLLSAKEKEDKEE